MKTGAIYARYSAGPRQTEQSIEGQVADCMALAKRKGIEIIEVYADRHKSGKTIKGRFEFQRMLADAAAGRFTHLIVWKVDRLGRDRYDLAYGKRILREAGVKILYATEEIPEGPMGIIVESMMEGFAEYYSAELAEKITRGQRESLKKGRWPYRLPYGYVHDAEHKVAPDPEEAALIRQIFDLWIDGLQAPEIARRLSSQGRRTRKGSKWTKQTLYKALHCEAYTGKLEASAGSLSVEPIIDTQTWDLAQGRFSDGGHGGSAKVEYLLSKKCRCARCGSLLYGESGTGKSGTAYYYYKCSGRKNGSGCDLPTIKKQELEDRITDATTAYVLTDDMIKELTRQVIAYQDKREELSPAAPIENALADVRRKRGNIARALEDCYTDVLLDRLRDLTAQENDLMAELAKMKRSPVFTENQIRAWLESFRLGDKTDQKVRKKLLDSFVSFAEVDADHAVVYYNLLDSEGFEQHEQVEQTGLSPNTPTLMGGRILLLVS